ncbi:MAG: SpoIIE family protein phosphatase [Verrucomicrobium sp.]|nr:SpoIIE family protein phosphatase [Verrucomicrobium sp.]
MISWGNVNGRHVSPTAEGTYREGAEVILHPSFSAVRPALEKMASFCRARGLPECAPEWKPIELATAEALNNAVEHGCIGARTEACVTLRWHWEGEWMEIEVLDPGSFHVPAGAPPPALPSPLAERGRGLYMIHTLLDGQVSHQRRPDGHAVVLRRRVGPARRGFPEEALRELESTLENMAEELSNSYESISALSYFGECLATSADFPAFVDKAVERLRKLTGAQNTIVRLRNEAGALERLGSPQEAVLVPPPPESLEQNEAHVAWESFLQNRETTVEDCGLLSQDDPLHRPGYMAFCVPISFQEDPQGVLILLRRREQEGPYFTTGELDLMRAVAECLGIARRLENLRRQRESEQRALRELEIAATLQRSLLPSSFPTHARFEIYGTSQSAHQVGGDYFDAIALPDGGVLLLIADVMGKGLPAALLATVFRTAVNARLPMAATPDRLLAEVNGQLERDLASLDAFITAQAAYLDPAGERLTLASAGHCPALRVNHRRRIIEQLDTEGLPLGVQRDARISARTIRLEEGDTLIFLTDGIYEVMNRREEPLELGGFMRSMTPGQTERAQPICAELLGFVSRYEEGRLPADDRTLLVASFRRDAP